MPNKQLVVPELFIDESTGAVTTNSFNPELLINPIQNGNAGDLPQLGRHFLSSAYLMLNQDSNTFTLWQASSDTAEDLVAVDRENKPIDQFCSANNNNEPPTPTPAPVDSDNRLSGGAIAGIVIGCVASVAGIAVLVFLFRKKREDKDLQVKNDPADDQSSPFETDGVPINQIVRHELPDKQIPRIHQISELP